MRTWPLPHREGHWWAYWIRPTPGTREGDEQTPALEWEVAHVVENCIDKDDPEHLMVMMPGVARWQALDHFVWGPEVGEPKDLPSAHKLHDRFKQLREKQT